MNEVIHKCGGNCCERFMIEASPQKIREEYLAWKAGTSESHRMESGRDGNRCYAPTRISADIHFIYPMLIYLGEHNWEPCDPKKITESKHHHYTCKHFNFKTRLCTMYDDRPGMCRNYPNGHVCLFPGCKIPGNEKKRKEYMKSREQRHRPKLKKSKRLWACKEEEKAALPACKA